MWYGPREREMEELALKRQALSTRAANRRRQVLDQEETILRFFIGTFLNESLHA